MEIQERSKDRYPSNVWYQWQSMGYKFSLKFGYEVEKNSSSVSPYICLRSVSKFTGSMSVISKISVDKRALLSIQF